MTRIQDFYNDKKLEGLTDRQISELSTDELPEYGTISDSKLFDNEEGDQNHWSAISL